MDAETAGLASTAESGGAPGQPEREPEGPLDGGVVRIWSAQGAIVGTGFLVSERHVLTCAHVVAQALESAAEAAAVPDDEVLLDFPLVAPGRRLLSRVLVWHPVAPDTAAGAPRIEDVAVLELTTAPAEDCVPAPLAGGGDLWGHPFRAFGFPEGYDDGTWAAGVIRGAQARGWVQVDGAAQFGYFVAPGFSGGPVWDDEASTVVGMVVGADRRSTTLAAYMIPTATLMAAWPELERRTRPPCPHRGLFAYREEDAPFFFGRESFTRQLVDATRSRSLIGVIGPSGCGKSSVVFAGLVPVLRREASWLIVSFRPGDHPLRALAGALIPLLEPTMSEADRMVELAKLAGALQGGIVPLSDVVARVVQKDGTATRMLLIADQFEELYTLCHDGEERRQFLDSLLPMVDVETQSAPPSTVVVLTLRADFVNHALSYRPTADALQDRDLMLGPMTRDELESVIEQPAALLGVKIEDGLTDRMLDAVGEEPGDLPLLEFALTLLWEKQHRSTMTHSAYDQIGGVEEALARRADEVYRGLPETEQQRAHRVFTQLVRPGEGTVDIRRLATRDEMGEETWDLVTRLASERLVVTGRDEATGEETVEVVHEALIGSWERLRGWMTSDRTFRMWQERLRFSMRLWDPGSRDESLLLRGAQLSEAEEWLKQREAELSPTEVAFIRASVAARERVKIERERARRRRLATIVSTIGLIAVIAVGLSIWALNERSRAAAESRRSEQQARIARSRELAAQAENRIDDQLDLALLLSLEAIAQTDTVEARGSLVNGLDADLDPRFFRSLSGRVTTLAYSPDGSLLAAADGGDTVVVWDVASAQVRLKLRTDEVDAVAELAFAPDGNVLAAASWDGPIVLWDIATGQQVGPPLTGIERVMSLAFSPDGSTLAAGGWGDRIFLWDRATNSTRNVRLDRGDGNSPAADDEQEDWAERDDAVSGLVFSPDGQALTSITLSGTIARWSVATGQTLGAPVAAYADTSSDPDFGMIAPNDEPGDVADFSADGTRWAIGGANGAVVLGDALTGQPLGQPLTTEANTITELAFSPDGAIVAAAGYGCRLVVISNCPRGGIWLWEVETGRLLRALIGQADEFVGLEFSPDGTALAAGGTGGEVVLRTLGGSHPLGRLLAVEFTTLSNIAFSPDGRLLAGAGENGEVILWDMRTDQPAGDPLAGQGADVSRVAFSPDGKLLASGSWDGTVVLWDVDTRQIRQTLQVSRSGGVTVLDFNPDGTTLAVASCELLTEDSSEIGMCARIAINLVNVVTGQVGANLATGQDEYILSMAFSPRGETLAVSSADGTLVLWDVTANRPRQVELDGPTWAVAALAFSPDGQVLATGRWGGSVDIPEATIGLFYLEAPIEDNAIILWDLATGRSHGEPLAGHAAEISSIVFSRDGQTVASGSWDGTVILWDLESRQAIGHPLGGHSDAVTSVAFSPDGSAVVALVRDDSVVRWETGIASWSERACAKAARNLNWTEWGSYFGDEPYDRTCPDFPPNNEGAFEVARTRARAGELVEAEQAFGAAVEWAGEHGDAWLNNSVCWEGSLDGFAAIVLPACERAVALAPDEATIRDSRGVARALTGDTAGAIEDFEFFLASEIGDEEQRQQRAAWITALKAGQNPFDEATLIALRRQ